MAATMDERGRDPLAGFDAQETAATARPGEWRDLVADVEDLIRKIADVKDIEIARVRERLKQTLTAAKESAAVGAQAAKTYAHDASVATDEYVRQRPWTAVGLAAALGVFIGVMVSRR